MSNEKPPELSQDLMEMLGEAMRRIRVENLLKEGRPVQEITEATGLDEEEVRKVQDEIEEEKRAKKDRIDEHIPDGPAEFLKAGELSTRQLIALNVYLATDSLTQAAKASGVVPRTVTRWLQKDTLFRIYEQHVRKVRASRTIDQLVLAMPKAAQNVYDAIENGDLKVSLSLLKGLGLLGGRMPT